MYKGMLCYVDVWLSKLWLKTSLFRKQQSKKNHDSLSISLLTDVSIAITVKQL